MSALEEVIDAPLDRQQLAKRWQLLCADPSFEDLAAKIELTEAWIVFPQSRQIEIYGRDGRREATSFPVDVMFLLP